MFYKLGIVYGFLFLQSKRGKPGNSHCGGVHTQSFTNGPSELPRENTEKWIVHHNQLKLCLSDAEPENANMQLLETTASENISEGNASSGADVIDMEVMQDVKKK